MSIIISYIIPAQFKPVPVLAKDPVAACKIPARVSASGMVSSVNKEHHSFILFPTQNVSASTHHETIPVQAALEKGPKWPNPIARLLSLHGFLHGFVSFTGKLAHFEDNSANIRSNLCSCAVIAVDSIVYLGANYGSNSVPMPPSAHNADTVALKSCILKYVQANTDSVSSKGEVGCWTVKCAW
jgi:hypothetical protein